MQENEQEDTEILQQSEISESDSFEDILLKIIRKKEPKALGD